ncbi:hypothetical protein KKA47_04575 [bacterium]|nr:hypothetical protein [bacterium]
MVIKEYFKNIFSLFVFGVICFALLSCGNNEEASEEMDSNISGQSCAIDQDCGVDTGYVCDSGLCVTVASSLLCISNLDCDWGYKCVNRMCVNSLLSNTKSKLTPCEEDDDCDDDLLCIDNYCEEDCEEGECEE